MFNDNLKLSISNTNVKIPHLQNDSIEWGKEVVVKSIVVSEILDKILCKYGLEINKQ